MLQNQGDDELVDVDKLKKIINERSSQEIVAKKIGVDRSTFYRKLKKGGNFKVREVQQLVSVIPLTDDEAISIFFKPKVAKTLLNKGGEKG
ncbi:XRE family transcriptional regulator [Lapidilactobacillus wuchangensis]|uniref:XRE family transcriptional regulator n=1 Tax=Lapidilactobacillus wuchangensis TaxID=2486001 RepID=UPI001CDD2BA1|nr:XRE family transcriptional regulator [Lapidilactobacillus wuchangensis]